MTVPPTSPVWVVGLHQHLLYMQEVNELENLGLDNSEGNGVISVLSDALNWRTPRAYPGGVQVEKQDWLDHDRYVETCSHTQNSKTFSHLLGLVPSRRICVTLSV